MTPSRPAEAPPRSRARRGDGDRLRDEILDAAEALLVEVGNVDAVSIRQIAKRVGCTPPSLYLHFADKDELVFHVCCRRFEEFTATLLAAVNGIDDPDDPVEAMMAMGRAYVAYGTDHPEAYKVLFGSMVAIPEDVDPAELPGMQAFGLLVDRIVQGAEAGVFHAPDPLSAAIGIWSTMHGLVLLLEVKAEGPIPIPEDIVEQVCRQAMNGLRVR